MQPTKIVIVPSCGHTDNSGHFDRGHTLPNLAEVDLVDMIVAPLCEFLEEYGVRHEVMPTRKHPGVAAALRAEQVYPGSVVVEIAAGWFPQPRTRNYSQVMFGSGHISNNSLAEIFSDQLAEWGSCAVYGHRSCNPKRSDDALLNVPDTVSVRIEPFALNGPDIDCYMRRVRYLGQDLAHVLIEFTTTRGLCKARETITFGR